MSDPAVARSPAGGGEGTSLQFAVYLAVGFGSTLATIVILLGVALVVRWAVVSLTLHSE